MNRAYSQVSRSESDTQIFNAFAKERFFSHDDVLLELTLDSTSLDKLTEIDDMISANITQMTRRARQDY